LDTVKTRIQNQNFETKLSGVAVVKDLIKHEGAAALFKGLTPKVRSVYCTYVNKWVDTVKS